MTVATILDFTDNVVLSDYSFFVRLLRNFLLNSRLFYAVSIDLSLSDYSLEVNSGITSMKLLSSRAVDIDEISAGAIGDVIILYFASPAISILHEIGNISLKGDPDLPDFPAGIGDILILIYDGTNWTELYRKLEASVWIDSDLWLDDVTWGD